MESRKRAMKLEQKVYVMEITAVKLGDRNVLDLLRTARMLWSRAQGWNNHLLQDATTMRSETSVWYFTVLPSCAQLLRRLGDDIQEAQRTCPRSHN